MNNAFFTGLLQAAKSDKVQFIAIAFCAAALIFYCGFKIIAFYKTRETKSDWSFCVFHTPSISVIKTFSSVGDCIDYFEKNYADDPDYDCIAFDPVNKRTWIGSYRGSLVER